jgi:aminotransferase EvaB
VPANDLGRTPPALAAEVAEAVGRVLRRGWYVLGPEVEAFEAELSQAWGLAGAVGVANGTDALELALRAVGCGPGDEVVVAANAGGYATVACLATGATPVLADVAWPGASVDPASVAAAVGPATRAVVVTHLYGIVADVAAVRAVLPAGVAVVEDAAQAHGGRWAGRHVGALGDAAAFSFYPTKNLGGVGDGGAVTSTRPEVVATARQLRQYGWGERFVAAVPGGRNSRLDEVQAAVLRAKLPVLSEANRRRRQVATAYQAAAGDRLRFAHEGCGPDDEGWVAHLCVARHPARDELQARLSEAGVAAAVHYPVPDHRQPGLSARLPAASLPVPLVETERAAAEVLSLPCFPELTDAEVDLVCRALDAALDRVGTAGAVS